MSSRGCNDAASMRLARDVSHRVVFMEQGRIAEAGPASEIFNNLQSPRLVEFLRSSRD
jgi:polar amino acid transport system ATP-binding protein